MFYCNYQLLYFVARVKKKKKAAKTHSFVCSGFAAGVDRRIVLQVRLRCTEGLVSWVYPGQALRVALEPNLSSIRYNTVCIQPSPSLSGASVFIERAGELDLLETEDGGRTGRQVFCFRADEPHSPVIYLQAGPQSPGTWIRRTVGFRYELLRNRGVYGELGRECRHFSLSLTDLIWCCCLNTSLGVAYWSIKKNLKERKKAFCQ